MWAIFAYSVPEPTTCSTSRVCTYRPGFKLEIAAVLLLTPRVGGLARVHRQALIQLDASQVTADGGHWGDTLDTGQGDDCNRLIM